MRPISPYRRLLNVVVFIISLDLPRFKMTVRFEFPWQQNLTAVEASKRNHFSRRQNKRFTLISQRPNEAGVSKIDQDIARCFQETVHTPDVRSRQRQTRQLAKNGGRQSE
jgi:hypothetical protein